MSREKEFTVPDPAKWNRLVLHDDLLFGEKRLPEGVGSKVMNDIAVDMKRQLNISSILKYMMSKSLLTNDEIWKLQDSSVPPDGKFLQLWQVLQGKGVDHGLLVFYLCLMESYGAEPGLTGHYVLCQIIRQKVRFYCKFPTSEIDQQDTERIVRRIKPLPLAHDQAKRLCQRLELPCSSAAKPPTLDVICNNWLATHNGRDWKVLAEVLLTERGLGCSLSGVLPPSLSNPPDVWNYVRDLGENWENLAEYLGFPRPLICQIQSNWSLDIPTQLQKFMQVCLIPNCKERMPTIVDCIKHQVSSTSSFLRDRDPSGGNEEPVPIGVFAQLLKHDSREQPTPTMHKSEVSASPVCKETTDKSDVATPYDLAPRSSESGTEISQPLLAKDGVSNQDNLTPSGSMESSGQVELGKELVRACISEHWQLAKSYIAAQCNLETKTKNGRRALHICCMKGKQDLVELLLQHGAYVSATDDDCNCCLHFREILKNEALVRLLIDSFATNNISIDQANMNGFTPLTIACQTGDICYDSALLLITNGARLNGMPNAQCTPLIYASGGGSVKLVELLLTFAANMDAQDRAGNTALIQACLCSHLEIARMLLKSGASVHRADKKGSTALAAAVSRNSYELVQTLIRHGANVNVTRYVSSEFTVGQVEETPLASACARGFQPIAELLIENRAKINHMCSGQVPPIGFAIICRQSHIVQYLLQLPGFNKSAYGDKALEEAKRKNLISFAQEIEIYMAMAGDEILSASPEDLVGTRSMVMEGESRVKVEEVLQKFCQISMSAISKKDLDSVVEIASAIEEPNVACFFREYSEGKLMMPDVLKARFLSTDRGTPAATFAIQHGLLDSIQFHVHALEAYSEGPQQFYKDLVWAFHQINGGEDLPWDINSVLERLFSGQFSLGVRTGSITDLSRDSIQGRKPSQHTPLQLTKPTLGTAPLSTIQTPLQPAIRSLASPIPASVPPPVIQSPPQPAIRPSSMPGTTPVAAIPQRAFEASPAPLLTLPSQSAFEASPKPGPATLHHPTQPSLPVTQGPILGTPTTPPSPSTIHLLRSGDNHSPETSTRHKASGVTPPLKHTKSVPSFEGERKPLPRGHHSASSNTVMEKESPFSNQRTMMEETDGRFQYNEGQWMHSFLSSTTHGVIDTDMEAISQYIADSIGLKWTQLYSYLCSEPKGRYRIDSNHRDEPSQTKTRNCTLDTIKQWRSSQDVCKLDEREAVRQLLLAVKKVRGCSQLVGDLCAAHGISLDHPTPEIPLKAPGQLDNQYSKDPAFHEEEGYSSDSSNNKGNSPLEFKATAVLDHDTTARTDQEGISPPTVRQDETESVVALNDPGQIRSDNTIESTECNRLKDLQIAVMSYKYKEGEHWEKMRLLGKGAFCECHLARDIERNTIFAVKQVSYARNTEKEQEDTLTMLLREVEIQQNLKHPNIVKCLGAIQQERVFNIFLEWVPAGSLDQLLEKIGPFTEVTVCDYIGQIIRGVAYLHKEGIIHRDLKGSNILVDRTGGRVLIGDFGTATILKTSTTATGEFQDMKGTAPFMAPEVMRGDPGGYGRKCDIWSIGCVIIQMATAKLPWESELDFTNNFAMINKIGNATKPPLMPEFTKHPQMNDVTARCLQINPNDRPTANDLLKEYSCLFTI